MSQPFQLSGQGTGASASSSVLPMNIQDCFTLGWFDLLAAQGTLKRLCHSSKASILWCSAFFMVEHPYMTTGKTILLTIWIFVGNAMSLVFNMLSRFVINFLPRGKCFLIFLTAVTFFPQWFWSQENKVCHCFQFFLIYLPWRDETRWHDLSF